MKDKKKYETFKICRVEVDQQDVVEVPDELGPRPGLLDDTPGLERLRNRLKEHRTRLQGLRNLENFSRPASCETSPSSEIFGLDRRQLQETAAGKLELDFVVKLKAVE
jgi:hypothetical protein